MPSLLIRGSYLKQLYLLYQPSNHILNHSRADAIFRRITPVQEGERRTPQASTQRYATSGWRQRVHDLYMWLNNQEEVLLAPLLLPQAH